MKKLLHLDVITKYFYPVTAGIETNILETYSVLARLGWSITIHTTTSTLDEKDILPKIEIIRGIKVIRYRESVFGYRPLINYAQTNLICLHNFNIAPHFGILIRALIDRLMGSKHYGIFLTPHGGFTPEWPMFSFISRVFKQLYHQTLGLFLINHVFDGVRAISTWEKSELVKCGIKPSKIVLIENGLDPVAKRDHIKLASPAIKKLTRELGDYVVAIGRISWVKNYETMIKAISRINSNLSLVIIGPVQDLSYQNSLTDLATSLGISNRVKFLGVVRGSDKYYLVQQAKSFIHMARWESFCNVVYEAMSLGKMCIVADNTALSSLVDDQKTGVVTPTYDSERLASYIGLFTSAKSSALSHKITQNLYSKPFPIWSETATKMNTTYKSIVGQYANIF